MYTTKPVYLVTKEGVVHKVTGLKDQAEQYAKDINGTVDEWPVEFAQTLDEKKAIEQSWIDNPDKSGGQYTDQEIKDSNEWR
jgi:hypothetical protein